SSLPNYTLTDDPPREGDPLSDASARAARLAEPRGRAPLRSGGGGRREEPVRERGHPDAPALAPRPLGAPVLGRRPGRGRHPGPRGRSAAEPAPPDPHQAWPGPPLAARHPTPAITAPTARPPRATARGSSVAFVTGVGLTALT